MTVLSNIITPSNVLTTTNTATVTNKTFGDNPTFSGGTANGVTFLNGSKVLTSGSALTYNGTSAQIGDSLSAADGSRFYVYGNIPVSTQLGIKIAGNATTYAQQAIRFYDTYTEQYAGYVGFTPSSLTFGQGTTEGMRLTSTGLGIGTSSPTSKLDVSGVISLQGTTLPSAGTARIFSRSSDSSLYLQAASGGTMNFLDGSQNSMLLLSSSTLQFLTGNTERARITSDGKLLVGTTTATDSPNSSTSKFVVSGDFTGGFGQSITDTSTNTAVDHYMMSFNLGTASGNQKGYIQFVGASGLILYATTSDQRLKTDLGVVTNTSVIDNLLIHDYTWKESGVAGRGVFAQEAYEVMPNAVGKGKDAPDGSINTPWGVDYSKFIPDLIVHAQQLKKQVQEQQAIIESLKARLDAANL